MKLYFAGDPGGGKERAQRFLQAGMHRYLYSYFSVAHNLSSHIERDIIGVIPDLFLDSGAFSAFTQKKPINLEKYIAYIHGEKNRLSVYAVLDVIGDAKGTAQNQAIMEANGLAPLPTFHNGSDYRELERLCERYDYIALGGLVPIAARRPVLTAHLDRCFSVIRKYWPKRIHGFGMSGAYALDRYPWYSADSSSYVTKAGFGGIIDAKGGKFRSVTGLSKAPKPGYEHLADFGGKAYMERRYHTISAVRQMERYYTDLWRERGIVWEK
jgi:hypothetical protein